MPGSSPASDFAVALLGRFVALGVRDVVLSPGSRSQALALAAAEYERAGLIRLRVRIDERVSGFLALGLAVETRMPALIVTTSGTAVANLHPAVLEAHHSGVPMILLTADRPVELRGIGSNQTTDQLGVFGPALRLLRDVEAPTDRGLGLDHPDEIAREALEAALGYPSDPAHAGSRDRSGRAALPVRAGSPGPVQVNLAFREPLSSPVGALPSIESVDLTPRRPETPTTIGPMEGTVVIAGAGAGAAAEEFARDSGSPLLAEITSGARFGPQLVVAYRELLAEAEFGGAVRRAVVFGHPTLSREIPALLMRADVQTVIVAGSTPEAYDPGRRAERVVDAVRYEGDPAAKAWAGRWVRRSREVSAGDGEPAASAILPTGGEESGFAREQASFSRAQLTAYRARVDRGTLVSAVWRATWPHDRLVLGASRLIRELDRSAGGKRVSAHANRGLAGIDGTIATAVGIALAAEADGATGTTRVLVGDLTLLHDVGALLFGGVEPRPRLQVIVGNDGGGTIFDGLEVAASAPSAAMERVLYTPQNVRLSSLADAYGWSYRLVSNRGELDEALTASEGTTLIEVPLPR